LRYQGPAYRAHDPRWSWSPTSGDGARLHGGRFNIKGTATLYLALDLVTAVNEYCQGLGLRLVHPATIVSYLVECDDIEDLTDTATLTRLGVKRSDLDCAWIGVRAPALSQALGERLRKTAAGIIVPSFAPGTAPNAKNLVLWRWGAHLPYKVETYDPQRRLPRNDSSWRR
jgi:RES domain-containing protein